MGQLVGLVVTMALLAIYFLVGELRHMTADAHDHDLALWVFGSDAAPGDHLHGRVWLDDDHANISRVEVNHWPARDRVEFWGETHGGDNAHRSDTLDFDFVVPPDAPTDTEAPLEIEVRSSAGDSTFPYQLHIYRKGTSILRRAGKAALAIGYYLALAALVFLLRRLYIRRGKDPSAMYLIPIVALGLVTFVPLVAQVTRLHYWWFAIVVLFLWTSGFWVAERVNRRLGLTLYELEPHADAPVRSSEDLENALLGAGLIARRSGKDIVVTKQRTFAVVPVSASGAFGAERFRFRASDPELARAIIRAVETVLGELRGGTENGVVL